VGGGPAGAALAIALAGRGVRVTVLEAAPGPRAKVGECLPPDAAALLDRFGLKDGMLGDDHLLSYGNRSIWGSALAEERDFLFGVYGPGWQLDRRKFELQLSETAARAGVDWRYGHRLARLLRQESGWELTARSTGGDKTFRADFVVDATGRPAWLARRLGARQVRYDSLIAVVVSLESPPNAGSRDSYTLVESTASGWWYSAYLPNRTLTVLYFTDADLIDHKLIRRDDGWRKLLETTTHTRRRVNEAEGPLSCKTGIVSANSARLDSVTGEGWLAVGDAAEAFDPLSSFGITSALGSGFYAAHAIADYLAGSGEALDTYRAIMDESYAHYLRELSKQYRLESRWPGEIFWQRRSQSHPLNYDGGPLHQYGSQ